MTQETREEMKEKNKGIENFMARAVTKVKEGKSRRHVRGNQSPKV